MAELDPDAVKQGGDFFRVQGVQLSLVESGEVFDPIEARVLGTPESESSGVLLDRMVTDLARKCGAALTASGEPMADADVRMVYSQAKDNIARLDIESRHICEQRNDDGSGTTRR